MRIAVCDDNVLFLKEIKIQLEKLDIVSQIFCYSSLKTFLFSVEDGQRYDAVLMDIEWQQDEREYVVVMDFDGNGLNEPELVSK